MVGEVLAEKSSKAGAEKYEAAKSGMGLVVDPFGGKAASSCAAGVEDSGGSSKVGSHDSGHSYVSGCEAEKSGSCGAEKSLGFVYHSAEPSELSFASRDSGGQECESWHSYVELSHASFGVSNHFSGDAANLPGTSVSSCLPLSLVWDGLLDPDRPDLSY